MNIDRFKHHHARILEGIAGLRELTRQGIDANAVQIANELKALSQIVIQHLAVEDRILYPSLEKRGDPQLAAMSRRYQNDMEGIASAFIRFVRHWSDPGALRDAPEAFRAQANTVLKDVHNRMMREDKEFYPAIERSLQS